MRREAELMTQVPENIRRSPVVSDGGVSSAKGLRGLVSEFDGTGSKFQNWKQQIELLRTAYNLDDSATRVLISSRLKGKALSWLHSKEHIVLSATNLLEEMQKMVDHHLSKLALRKKFEQRTWRVGETFTEYYYDKIILTNRIPIAVDEIVNYVVDGVPDAKLQD